MRVHGTSTFLRDARGFTLVELLVVLLILGILATIAMPGFIGQRLKAQDAEAQSMVRTATTALRTHELDHDTFNATRSDLENIEPAIGEASGDFHVEGTALTFTIRERSVSGTDFTLTRDSDGKTTRTCSVPGRGLCRAALDADGNRW
jgi:prepilin-type N-terminal cleavage/methylation domain-containing protein